MNKHHILVTLFTILFTVHGLYAHATDYLLNIEPSAQGTVAVYRLNGTQVDDNKAVTAGETLRLIATVTDENYTFSHFSVENGSSITMESETKGTFVVGGGKVRVSAFFAGKPQVITITESDKKQGNYAVIWSGKTLKDGDSVPYGAKITIKGLPKEGFCTAFIEANKQQLAVEKEMATTTVNAPLTIQVQFAVRMLTVHYTNVQGDGIKLNVYNESVLVEPEGKVPYGTKLDFEITRIYKVNRFDLSLNHTLYQPERIKDEGSGYYTHGCAIEIKEDIVASVKNLITKSSKGSVDILQKIQYEIYDGKPKSFNQFNPTIAGLYPSHEITYKKADEADFTDQQPTAVGSYKVLIFRAADYNYQECNNELATLEISQAPTTITTPPVAIPSAGKLVLSGGSASWQGGTVAGEFELESEAIPTESKLIKVTFIPTDKNLAPASCMIPCVIKDKPLESYAVRIGQLPSGVTLSIMNGDQIVKSNEKLPKGTSVTLNVTGMPKEKKVGVFINQLSEETYEEIHFPLILDKEYNFSVLLENDLIHRQSLSFVKEKLAQTSNYSGVPLVYTKFGLATPTTTEVNKYWVFTYTEHGSGKSVVAPVHAGVYDVDIYYPQTEFTNELKGSGTLTVKPINPELKDIAQLSVSEVLPGQTLASSVISGGDANVPGKYVWKDPSQKVVANKAYPILFIPNDQQNYNTMSVKEVSVPVSNDASKMAITIYAEHGTIRVINKNSNAEVRSGDIVGSGDVLTINAFPAAGYKLTTLMVDGNTILNGTTFTVQQVPPAILAEFESLPITPGKPSYTVTVPSVTGAIVSNTGTNFVVEGGSFSFTIDYDLLYGLPTVTAGGNALTHDGADTYTISPITQDVVVTISLPNYGHYKANLPQDTHLGSIKVENMEIERETGTSGYPYGSLLKLTATPVEGVSFDSWWDGNTENPREYIIRSDINVAANFSGKPTNIDKIESSTRIWTADQTLFIFVDKECTAQIIDMQGQIVHKASINGQYTFNARRSGIYIVILNRGTHTFFRQKIILK